MSSFFRSLSGSGSSTPTTPPPPPLTTSIPTSPTILKPPTRPPPLEGEHLTLYQTVLDHFSPPDGSAYQLEGAEQGKEGLLRSERMWLTEDCLCRYLRAQKWDAETAITRIIATLLWRRETGIADDDGGEGSKEEGGGLLPGPLAEKSFDGDDFVVGWAESGHPLHYQYSARNTSNDPQTNLLASFWQLERVQDLMPAGVEKQILLVNFAGAMSAKLPSVTVIKGYIHVLGAHYPERMEKAIAINVPWMIHSLLKVVLPFMDPVTRAKLSFNEPTPFIPDEQLLLDFGGKLNLDPKTPEYRQNVIELCREKRKAYRERWVKDGSKIGASEWVLKGGDEGEKPVASTPFEVDVDVVKGLP